MIEKMKKTIILILLSVFGMSFAYPRHISFKQREYAFQHRRARVPSFTRVSADYEDGKITLDVTGYTGNVQVYVSDSQGNVVGYTMSTIVNGGAVTLDIGNLKEGYYTLDVVLDNAAYVGQFDA
jgi:hypothetical protein